MHLNENNRRCYKGVNVLKYVMFLYRKVKNIMLLLDRHFTQQCLTKKIELQCCNRKIGK